MDSNSLARSTNYGMRSAASSSMQQLIAHSDNMKQSLQNKINMKLQFEAFKQKYHRSALSKGNIQTRASELRTRAQLTNKMLNDMNHSLDVMRANKASNNNASFVDIERENQRVNKMLQLPPIERIQSLAKNGGKITINGKTL